MDLLLHGSVVVQAWPRLANFRGKDAMRYQTHRPPLPLADQRAPNRQSRTTRLPRWSSTHSDPLHPYHVSSDHTSALRFTTPEASVPFIAAGTDTARVAACAIGSRVWLYVEHQVGQTATFVFEHPNLGDETASAQLHFVLQEEISCPPTHGRPYTSSVTSSSARYTKPMAEPTNDSLTCCTIYTELCARQHRGFALRRLERCIGTSNEMSCAWIHNLRYNEVLDILDIITSAAVPHCPCQVWSRLNLRELMGCRLTTPKELLSCI